MTRCRTRHRVFFIEEPIERGGAPTLRVEEVLPNLERVIPELPPGTSGEAAELALRELLGRFAEARGIQEHVLWFYTPMALPWTRALSADAVVYDCMDELSLFAGAPPLLQSREAELFQSADVVFTGGRSLYEVKRDRHPAVFCFPSSVDRSHFARARGELEEPPDQRALARPRAGYYGVIDERIDLELIAALAELSPDLQLVMLGPTAKIDPRSLPRRPNIHWLGFKPYDALPEYLAGWDVALLPFARNDATRLISPTKTPEYLASGRPVVSTPVRDVAEPYGRLGLARIADDPLSFAAAVRAALAEGLDLATADDFLAQMSWDETWLRMEALIEAAVETNRARNNRRTEEKSCSII